MIEPGLENKVVLITGANHGIGAATARAFAAQKARVCLSFFREARLFPAEQLEQAQAEGEGGVLLYHARHQQSAEPLVAEICAQGGQACSYEADLGDPDQIPRLFDLCEEQLGPVDILVNNHTYCVLETFDPASVRSGGFPVSLVSAAEIDAHFAVNARAVALLMSEYFQRYLQRKATGGRVINLSTDAAHAHVANVSYAASKHAIESYSRSAAAEMGKYGVTVNIVAPGPVQTGYIEPQAEKEIAAGTPLGRVGEPADIADVIVFLASEQARWLTGQLLYVGGGWRMGQ